MYTLRATVYQDEDPLGAGEWYGYATHPSGHIVANYGGFRTAEDAKTAIVAAWPNVDVWFQDAR